MTGAHRVRPVETTSDGPMTLADVEAFCRVARQQGGSDDDQVTLHPVPVRIRGLRCKVRTDHNREQAYRKDQNA